MKNKILLILLTLFYISASSQIYLDFIEESETKNFNEIVTKTEAYYADKEKGRGSGYKQFKRWEHHNSTRLNAEGKVIDLIGTNFNEHYYYQENYSNNSGLAQKSLKSLNGDNSISGNWEAVGPINHTSITSPGGLGRVNTIEFDPVTNDQYLGIPTGGLWRKTSNGFEALTDGMPTLGVSGIAIDYSSPSNNRTIYILTGDGEKGIAGIGILKSTDHGETWYSTGLTGFDIGIGYKLKMHPEDPEILFAVGSKGVFKTVNGGLSWVNTTTSVDLASFSDIEFKPNNPSIMYASYQLIVSFDIVNGRISTTIGHRIAKSIDSGNTWYEAGSIAEDDGGRTELAVTPANSNYVYAIIGGYLANPNTEEVHGFNGVYRSIDSGESFSRKSNSPNIIGGSITGKDNRDQSDYDLAIAVSPTDADDVFVGGINTWRSSDGGISWINTSYWAEREENATNYVHADIHDLKFNNGSLYCANDGGISKGVVSANNITWTDVSQAETNGLQISQAYKLGLGTTNSTVYFGLQDNGLNLLKTNTTNKYNTVHWFGADGFETVVLSNSSFVLGATQYGALRLLTDENDLTANVKPSGVSGAWSTPLVSVNNSGTNPDNIIYVGYQDVFKQTTNYTDAPTNDGWKNISNGQIGDNNCVHIAVAPSDNDVVYVSKNDGELFKTTNNGTNWTEVSPDQSGFFKKLSYFVIHPEDPDIVYTVISGTIDGLNVLKTTNGGETWENISGSLPNVTTNCILHDGSDTNGLYVGTDIGVFYIDDDLDDWIPFYNDLPNVQVNELEIDPYTNTIYAATWGRGIWKSSLYGKYCQSFANLSDNLEGFKLITANDISSSSVVEPFAEVSLTASNSIVLTNGFVAVPNDDEMLLHASINSDVCSQGTSAKNTSGKTGVYAGPLPGVLELQENDILETSNYLYVFPNPSDSYIYMQFEMKEPDEVSFNLFDMKGSRILNEKRLIEYSGTVVEKLDSSYIQSGQYILEVVSKSNRETKKIIIQH